MVSPPMAAAFIVIGILFLVLREAFGLFRHRKIYAYLPAMLIGNGIGFLIPARFWIDGLILTVAMVILDHQFILRPRRVVEE